MALTGAEYGEGVGAIFFETFFCSGSEDHLLDCFYRRVGEGTCSHQQDAAVKCSGEHRHAINGSLPHISATCASASPTCVYTSIRNVI